jgi:hypothetical protein
MANVGNVASPLETWAANVSGKGRSGGTEFSSQKALESYLRLHPNADRSKHWVAQEQGPHEHEMPTPRQSARASRVLDPATYAHLPSSVKQNDRDPNKIFKDAAVAHQH